MTTEEGSRGNWWKRAFLTLGALIGATVIWGWLSPEPEPEAAELTTVPAEPVVAAPDVLATAAPDAKAPAWLHPTILWTVGVLLAVIVGLALLGILRQVVTYLVLALFFSFALEPAVNYMHGHWHWKRGTVSRAPR